MASTFSNAGFLNHNKGAIGGNNKEEQVDIGNGIIAIGGSSNHFSVSQTPRILSNYYSNTINYLNHVSLIIG